MTFGNEFWSAVAGAIVASIATGLISYILQRQAFSAEQKQREDERTENRRALGHALMFKMIKIHFRFRFPFEAHSTFDSDSVKISEGNGKR